MTKLAHESRGAGPTLVLLHAFPFDRRMWSEEVARLSDGRRVVAVDLRGFGESPLWGEPTIDELGDDVVALLDELGVPMASVCGLSMGGYVALSIAERHRGRVAALVLADTRAAADSDVAGLARQATMRQVRSDGPAAFLDGVPERLLSRHASDDLRQRVRDLCVDRSETILAATRAMAHRPDRTSLLAAHRLPDAGHLRRRGHDVAGAGDALAGGADSGGRVRRDRRRGASVEPGSARSLRRSGRAIPRRARSVATEDSRASRSRAASCESAADRCSWRPCRSSCSR